MAVISSNYGTAEVWPKFYLKCLRSCLKRFSKLLCLYFKGVNTSEISETLINFQLEFSLLFLTIQTMSLQNSEHELDRFKQPRREQ